MKKFMTTFETLLRNAKTGEEILNMQSCAVDNLTEDEVIALKAKYLGMDSKTVKNMLAGLKRLKKQMSARPLQTGMNTVINCIL